ncbi:hypothetical protein HYS92_00160 [Candidatus Daviesbacteria bacterium]|nr:hypothetical protein [Candidatus Daviesbacteria bacterium]
MKLRNNILVIGSVVLIAIAVAYYFLIYLPKQQELRLLQEETTLRKQTYELCLKEVNNLIDESVNTLGRMFAAGEITKQVMEDRVMILLSKKDEVITNCVEKRIQEYRK